MPVWHEATEKLAGSGRVRSVGIVQEQHPDRARLFMQWKRMDWPVLADPFNRLGVAVVPITLFVDEHGVVRKVRPRRDDLAAFVSSDFDPPPIEPVTIVRKATPEQQAFRRGVELRMRYDAGGAAEDFRAAVEHWSQALEADPNQYIWRRRLQQYGPRLDKPYPFYDWVDRAREEILARGERPVTLPVEPAGAELATPLKEFVAARSGAEPDPDGKVLRDPGKFVLATSTVIPARLEPGKTARVHLELRPDVEAKAHWNNEARGTTIWIDPPDGWTLDRRRIELANPPAAVSEEPRRAELELRSPADFRGRVELPAYALYYVCEGVDGACLYRRQDLELVVEGEPR